ncbi:uncharacterized protein BX664DRAFT_283104 [Halteromyces radiatus]|uniref:uncharacterized protein n=1 Tax=Halteromyces radiatus TaxID=101107 RepID=UPI00221FA87B|nr:uncharacterized protein BX664DRAFT_283104 [Halteromyces radiatus]KAI8084499.1 hypothetical protein BX664DRAFT_283104 [Halteromyces radiatus]
MTSELLVRQSPITIPEIAQLICYFVDGKDMLNMALSCRTMYYAMIVRLWHTLQPRSHMVLRKLKNTLDGKGRHLKTNLDPQYNRLVRVFRWSLKEDVTTHMFERPFFDGFIFPRLDQLVFSYAAAQDSSVAPMIRASSYLRYVDLSHCYCLSTDAIQPLLDMPLPRLETLILYGCGKIESKALATLIQRHHRTLTCLRLTDITDDLLDVIQQCHHLQDLGLEHCSDYLTYDGLSRFAHALEKQHIQLTRLRFRDIANLTSEHMERIAFSSGLSLVHLDMSECARITSDGLAHMAPHCPSLDTLCLAYQSGVTDTSIQQFSQSCHQLKHLDVSGSRSLTDHAFAARGPPMGLTSLNLSGLESQLSSDLIYQLLIQLPALQELCLGVAYDLKEAMVILDQVNASGLLYEMNVEKCHTICRLRP